MIGFLSWTYMLHLLEGRNQKPEMGRKGCKETEGSNGNQECAPFLPRTGADVSGLSNGTADLKGYETLRSKLRTDFPRAHMVNLHPGMETGARETQAAAWPLKCCGGPAIMVGGKHPFLQVPTGVY